MTMIGNCFRGRGEAIRLLMEDAGMTWSEVNFDKETWPAHKEKGLESGLYTFGQGTFC